VIDCVVGIGCVINKVADPNLKQRAAEKRPQNNQLVKNSCIFIRCFSYKVYKAEAELK
jgi:hypothetical protein